MINSNKIYFISGPLGQHSTWCLENLEKLFSFNDNNKVYFKFGSPSRLCYTSAVRPYDRISLVINDHISNFQNVNFVYHGWELLTCLDDLYRDFPGSEFLFIVNNESVPTITGKISRMRKFNDEEFLISTAKVHTKTIHEFVEGKTHTSKIREEKDSDGLILKSITTYHLVN